MVVFTQWNKPKGEDTTYGNDSGFYLIEKYITEAGYARYPWETLSHWLKRLEETAPGLVIFKELNPLLKAHYMYRFDPQKSDNDLKKDIEEEVQGWLNRKV